MMSPEGQASASSNQVPGPQQAEVVGQPSTLVKVSVPTGAVPGQQINFTMPSGQRVSTSVQEHVQPGALLTVAVPSPSPAEAPVAAAPSTMLQPGLAQARETLLPQPVVINATEADRQASQCGWIAFALSFLVCCLCSAPVALCIWGGVALNYFCKPREERNRHPRSFAPACASAVTIGVLCGCFLLAGIAMLMVFAICGPFDPDNMHADSCPGLEKWINSTHMNHHHHWHPQWTNLRGADMDEHHHGHHGWHHHWHPHWLMHGSHDFKYHDPSKPVILGKAESSVPMDFTGSPVPMGQHTIEEAPYFLANGGESCAHACENRGGCNGAMLAKAASSVEECKSIIRSLGKTTVNWGEYKDDDSGCAYHPGQGGWSQTYLAGSANCDTVNADPARQRVCACNEEAADMKPGPDNEDEAPTTEADAVPAVAAVPAMPTVAARASTPAIPAVFF